MDIKYTGNGKPANKKITYFDNSQNRNVQVEARFQEIDGAYVALGLPSVAGEKLLKSPNFVELVKKASVLSSKGSTKSD